MEWSSRRKFLGQTFAFSAAVLLAQRGRADYPAAASPIQPGAASRHFFAVGDWGQESSQRQQRAVALAMQQYAAMNALHVENLLMLGDNWYGWLFGGADSTRWRSQFEDMYPASSFPGKAYAILGNHDYESRPGSKVEAELAYAREKNSRWFMPARWYSFDLPEEKPLARVIALDTNYPAARGGFFRTTTLTDEQVAQQNAWLRKQLEQPSEAIFTIVLGHHPIFSNGDHGDTPALIRDWDPLLREKRVHLYLGGHDHDLQHLEIDGSPVSYVISGGGGATLRKMKVSASRRGPYGIEVAGFTHLELSGTRMTVRHVSENGEVLHSFSKDPLGRVSM